MSIELLKKVPLIIEQQKSYWDRHPIGAEIASSELGSEQFYDRYLAYYDRFYDYKRGTFIYEKYAKKRVLEIGCGLGIDTIKFAHAGATVTAVDLSETSVNCTRKLFEYHGLDADIRLGNAEKLEFSDESFDVVYACGVLMLVPDIQASIDEIHRVLRRGGEALVVLYHRWSWFWLLVKLSGTKIESEDGDPPLNRVHSRRETQRMFSRFSSVNISFDRPPQKTLRRKGIMATAYNYGFVPLYRALPSKLTARFGWHIIIKAVK